MSDIAREANVSTAAVSLVLNGKAGSHVSAREQEKVISIARKHNYRLNLSASNLRKMQQKTIGICMPAPVTDGDALMLLEQQRYLQEFGCQSLFSFWQVPIVSTDRFRQEMKNAFEVSFSHNVNGIIAWYYTEALERENIPTVIFGSIHAGFDCVTPDYAGQAVRAVELLAGLGHRDLAYFGYSGIQAEFVRNAVLAQGLPFHEDWFCIRTRGEEPNPVIFSGLRMSRILHRKRRPTGIICHTARLAEGVRTAVVALGLRIPEDISIVTLDMVDTEQPARLFDAVSTDVRENVKTAVDCLMARIGDRDRPLQSIYIKPEYRPCGSCAPAGSGRIRKQKTSSVKLKKSSTGKEATAT
ncbi:MAG: LacI family DNA-binding transcriptional regulator [Lentisphaeria bacterium]|nr:LacI family DNA-binding transcriptional regulator [Lentisphaeria bacterium]